MGRSARLSIVLLLFLAFAAGVFFSVRTLLWPPSTVVFTPATPGAAVNVTSRRWAPSASAITRPGSRT